MQDIPPPVYTNVATNNQTDTIENGNTEVTQPILVHQPVSPQVIIIFDT